ncbi:hypothetical protein H9X96_20900 [Pedobacter sp. N36a]|uniref:hypothetical protein n=1 Tax=Pedobacter sp. N36a TaxID=2767996 RepID=UPI001656C42A|nr:hypothetical protein [Pedobacter sp. N36a]MBC8988220.1 hypothetical protein [Pedobacter sp. N36a]
MKPYLFNKGWKNYALLALSICLLSSCEGAGDVPVERKKMPRFSNSGFNLEEEFAGRKSYTSCGMTFETELITLGDPANSSQYICIPLADAEADAAAFTLINMFKPFASIYMSEWAKMNSKGVMIDLRTDRQQQGHRADYQLKKDHSFSIPVVILSDAKSAIRAKGFTQLMGNLPGVTSIKTTHQFTTD